MPFTLAIGFLLLYLAFRSAISVTLFMEAMPFALIGSFWLIDLLDPKSP